MIAGKYRDAIESFHRMKSLQLSHCYLAICHVELGEIVEAQACLERFRMVSPETTPAQYIAEEPYADAAIVKRMTASLRRADPATK